MPPSAINPDTLIIQSIAYSLYLSHPASYLQFKNSYDGYYHNLNWHYIILLMGTQSSFDLPAVTNHMPQCTAWTGLFVHFQDWWYMNMEEQWDMMESKIPFPMLPSPQQIVYRVTWSWKWGPKARGLSKYLRYAMASNWQCYKITGQPSINK